MTKSKYDWQLKYRRLITEKPYIMFFLVLFFTIIFGMGLKGLSQNPDNRIFFSKDNPQLLALEALERTYTRNDNVFILLDPKEGDVFTPETLEAVRYLTDRLWKTPSSSRVDSITNFQWTRAKGDNIIISDLVTDSTISNDVAENAREVALNEPMLVNLHC